jgi:hypothetical protein
MSLLVYKVLHIFGILLAFVSLGGLTLRALAGGGGDRGRRLASVSHGVALLVILVSGFGLLARLGLGFPGWVWLKVAIWVVVGALVVAIRRLPQYATVYWFALPVLGALAAYVALTKPG